MIIYGIKNCSTMKKAFSWFDHHNISYEFVDYRKPPLPAEVLKMMISLSGLETLVNKKSATWRKLNDAEKIAVLNEDTAIDLLQAHPTLIKRPVISAAGKIWVGFDEDKFEQNFL